MEFSRQKPKGKNIMSGKDEKYIFRSCPEVCEKFPPWAVGKVSITQKGESVPEEYDLRRVHLWLLKDQEQGPVPGRRIFQFLANQRFRGCFGAAELWAIAALDIEVFREICSGMELFAWRDVLLCKEHYHRVLSLTERDGEMVHGSRDLREEWGPNDPAPRFGR